MKRANETDVVVDLNVVLEPHVHDHALRAVRSASAAAVSGEVLSASVQPAAVRVVAIGAVVLEASAQFVAHRHAASLNLPGSSVFPLLSLISESLGALLLLSLLLLVGNSLLISSGGLGVGFLRFLILLSLLRLLSAASLLLRSVHGQLGLLALAAAAGLTLRLVV